MSARAGGDVWTSTPPPGPWVEDAACARLHDVGAFTTDAPAPDALAGAVAVCRRCPVSDPCGQYGRNIRGFGVWGGELLHNGKRKPMEPAVRVA